MPKISTRNTAYNDLVASTSRMDLRKNFFSNRVINTWNTLPQDVKESKSLNIFRIRLDDMTI